MFHITAIMKEIVLPLLAWYDDTRRILPWREEPTPYHVWISEVMLQQTRVGAVRSYYERFIKTLPDIKSLAAAEGDTLLKLWEGLGYYNRARNLKKAARTIMTDYHGVMPSSYEELLKLPGIGSYTAGAISSIAYGSRVPAVDGNVLRVLSRLWADSCDIAGTTAKRNAEQKLADVIPADRPGDFNQALMELGAVICIPNGTPRCLACPCQTWCMAHLSGREKEFPHKSPKKTRIKEDKTILLFLCGKQTVLRKRPERGLLAGMYEFPSWEGHLTEEEVRDRINKMGWKAAAISKPIPGRHIFTHVEWHMTGYLIRLEAVTDQYKGCLDEWFFVEPEAVYERFPVPAAYAAYSQYLKSDISTMI